MALSLNGAAHWLPCIYMAFSLYRAAGMMLLQLAFLCVCLSLITT